MTPKARAWIAVGLLWGVGYSNYLTRFMLITMHGSVVAAIPMSDTQFGLLMSVFLWIYGVANPIGGFLADRLGRSRVILTSLIAWTLLTLVTPLAHTFGQLLAVRAAFGIAQACYIPAACALIADYHQGSTRSFATGLHMTGVTLGVATSGLGGLLAERHSFGFAFISIGLASLVYSLILIFFLRDPPRSAAEPTTGEPVEFGPALRSLFGSLSFDCALIYWGLIGAVTWAITTWMPTHMQEHYHLAQSTAGFWANGALFLVGLPGLLAGGAWADRWSKRNRRAPIYVPAIGMLLSVPVFWLSAQGHVLAFLIINLLVWGVANSFAAANMMPILCLIADRRYRATGYGVLNAASAAFGGVAIYYGGALRDSHLDLSRFFPWLGMTVAGCALLLLTVRTTSKHNHG